MTRTIIRAFHRRFVFARRVRALADRLAPLFPQRARILDIGCGDGRIAASIAIQRPDLMIEGVDVLVRARTHIPVRRFDGITLPFEDSSFGVCLFVDVLHHTDEPRPSSWLFDRNLHLIAVAEDRPPHLEGSATGSTLRSVHE